MSCLQTEHATLLSSSEDELSSLEVCNECLDYISNVESDHERVRSVAAASADVDGNIFCDEMNADVTEKCREFSKGIGGKVHPKAAKWKSTLLPCFKELSIIFGKDRATRNLTKNLEDVVEELNTEAAGETLQDDIQSNPISDESTSKK
ncbi:hypothetical protein POM88_032290 [Heracleum sosnowskyi]|uniref:Uncharacterized protein n=1 Tax=Heracleum sosnowskyi TaxID=360622 RepID=A0AAD8MKE7_9APIA|nr:hypothetical protein POM88_032290 [Heracleum sosnowskyi]